MSAFLVGILYVLFGIVLLFFGARFIKVVLAVYGALIGINIGQVLVSWWGLHNFWAFLVVVICMLAIAAVAVMFYKMFIAAGVGYLAAVIIYNLTQAWGWSHTLDIVLGLAVGVGTFLVINRFDLVEIAFKFITSVQGATALVSGIYVMFYTAKLDTLQTNHYDVLLGASVWWVIFWLVAFSAGLSYQLRTENKALTTV